MTANRVDRVSVIVPAHNEAAGIARTVGALLAQGQGRVAMEVIVVDDGSSDATMEIARAAGARVIETGNSGNPAAARNKGAAIASGDPLIFLDADCEVLDGWLDAIVAAHERGETIVAGAIALPPGLSPSARCDYYCGWYLAHPRRPAGYVPHAPAPHVSVRREPFLNSSRFEELPYAIASEERLWQAELLEKGHRIYFEPAAIVQHYNRPGLGNLLRRSYRWGYGSIESKNRTSAARFKWIYRYPRLLILLGIPLAFAHTGFILWCWLRAGVIEPLVMSPLVLAARLVYSIGMMRGGIEWLRRGSLTSSENHA